MINTRDIVEEYRYSSNEKKSVCRKNYKATYGFFYTIHVYLGKIFCTILGMIFLAKSPHDGISRPTNDLAHICRPFCDAPTNYTLRTDASPRRFGLFIFHKKIRLSCDTRIFLRVKWYFVGS